MTAVDVDYVSAELLRITLDTSAVNAEGLARVEAACAGRDVEVKHTTVTDRAQEGTGFAATGDTIPETGVWDESRWGEFVWGAETIPETLVLGESRLGEAAIGSDAAPGRLEATLTIINGDRHFPPPGEREELTDKQRNRLRAAMIFEAHCRERRDVFVTNDERDFIRGGRRDRLQTLCSRQIFTVERFCEWIEELGR